MVSETSFAYALGRTATTTGMIPVCPTFAVGSTVAVTPLTRGVWIMPSFRATWISPWNVLRSTGSSVPFACVVRSSETSSTPAA